MIVVKFYRPIYLHRNSQFSDTTCLCPQILQTWTSGTSRRYMYPHRPGLHFLQWYCDNFQRRFPHHLLRVLLRVFPSVDVCAPTQVLVGEAYGECLISGLGQISSKAIPVAGDSDMSRNDEIEMKRALPKISVNCTQCMSSSLRSTWSFGVYSNTYVNMLLAPGFDHSPIKNTNNISGPGFFYSLIQIFLRAILTLILSLYTIQCLQSSHSLVGSFNKRS